MEIAALPDNFLQAIAKIAKSSGDAFARNREHGADPGKRNKDINVLGLNSAEHSPLAAPAKFGIEMEYWWPAPTALHPKRWPRNDIVWVETTFYHKSARHVPVQWQDVT